MSSFQIKVEGIKGLKKDLARMGGEIPESVTQAIEEVCYDLESKSIDLAPVREGFLRRSTYVGVDKNGRSIDGTVGYTEPYALRQHENLEYSHPKGGQAKYLSQPLEDNSNAYIKDISSAIKKVVK